MNNRVIAIAVSAGLLYMAGTAEAAPAQVRFKVGETELAMPLPESYCEPTGRDIELAAMNASADPDNVTLATLLACTPLPNGSRWHRYVLLKVPRGVLAGTFQKQDFLAQMVAVFTGPNAPTLGEKETQEMARDTERALGRRIEIRGTYGYDGYDADCLYLAGPLQAQINDKLIKGQAASCFTVSGGKPFIVHVYELPPVTPLDKLKVKARDIANSVHP